MKIGINGWDEIFFGGKQFTLYLVIQVNGGDSHFGSTQVIWVSLLSSHG